MISKSLEQEISQFEAELCYALADSTRLLILYALDEKAYNVTDLSVELNLTQPTTSRHLKILRDQGLVDTSRQGKNVIYRLKDQRLIQALNLLRAVLRDRIAHKASVMDKVSES